MKRALIISLLISVSCLLCGQTTRLSVSGTQVQTVKVFDDNTTAAVLNHGTLSGVAAGHTVGVLATANYAHANADSNITITVNYVLTGADSALYTLDTTLYIPNGIINKRQLYRDSLVPQPVKIYDGMLTCSLQFNGIARNYVTHHILTTIDTCEFLDPNAGYNKPVRVIFGMSGEDVDNYIAPPDTVLVSTILPRTLQIKNVSIAKVKPYDGTAVAQVTNSGWASNILDEDTVYYTITAAYEDKNAGKGKTIHTHYEISGPDTMNYAAPDDGTIMNGEIKALQLTAEGGSVECTKDYDGTTHAVVNQPCQPVGVLQGEQVYLNTNAEFEDENPGTGKTVYCWYTIYGRDIANYIAPVDSIFCTDGVIRDSVSALENVTLENMTVYPNPATDWVAVDAEHIAVYNMAGMKVYEGVGGIVDVRGWAEGVYVVKSEAEKCVKLIICR